VEVASTKNHMLTKTPATPQSPLRDDADDLFGEVTSPKADPVRKAIAVRHHLSHTFSSIPSIPTRVTFPASLPLQLWWKLLHQNANAGQHFGHDSIPLRDDADQPFGEVNLRKRTWWRNSTLNKHDTRFPLRSVLPLSMPFSKEIRTVHQSAADKVEITSHSHQGGQCSNRRKQVRSSAL